MTTLQPEGQSRFTANLQLYRCRRERAGAHSPKHRASPDWRSWSASPRPPSASSTATTPPTSAERCSTCARTSASTPPQRAGSPAPSCSARSPHPARRHHRHLGRRRSGLRRGIRPDTQPRRLPRAVPGRHRRQHHPRLPDRDVPRPHPELALDAGTRRDPRPRDHPAPAPPPRHRPLVRHDGPARRGQEGPRRDRGPRRRRRQGDRGHHRRLRHQHHLLVARSASRPVPARHDLRRRPRLSSCRSPASTRPSTTARPSSSR